MANILEQYKAALEAERMRENKDFPTGSNLNENDRAAYESALDKLRNGNFSEEEIAEARRNSQQNEAIFGKDVEDEKANMQYEAEYQKRINETLSKYDEEGLAKANLLKSEPIHSIQVLRAYCPECGEELISTMPPMLNAFTQEKICLHKCKCGKKYNLEYAYPRLVIMGENNEEIKAWGL